MPSISTRTSAERKFKQGVSSLWTFGLALLLVGLLGYPGRAQDPGTPGAPPLASRSGHVVSLQAPTPSCSGIMRQFVTREKLDVPICR